MKLKSLSLLLAASALMAGATNVSAQVLTPGDLVVSAYGTSTSTGLIDGQAVPISLQLFAPSTTATLESPISTTTLSGIAGEYGSSSEGNIQLSGNGEYLTIAGYNASEVAEGIGANTNGDNGNATYPVGTPYGGTVASGASYDNTTATALGQSSPADVARLADVIDGNGNVVSSTSFANIYNTNNPRSAYSASGSSIYISGQGDKTTAQQGIFYSATGASYSGSNAPTEIYNAKDTRYVTAYNGNLYYSIDKSGSPTGIFEYSGSPTAAGSIATQITAASNGLTGAGKVNYSPEGFWFANATTLYVADTGVPKAGGTGDGGIQKWTFSSNLGTWTLSYTLTDPNFIAPSLASTATSGQTGFEAITGQVVGNTVDLYAVSYTAGDDNPNGLYAIADSLSATSADGESFTELASAPGSGQENFKGVSFAPTQAVPEPSTTSMLILTLLGGAAFAWKRKKSLKA